MPVRPAGRGLTATIALWAAASGLASGSAAVQGSGRDSLPAPGPPVLDGTGQLIGPVLGFASVGGFVGHSFRRSPSAEEVSR